MWQLHFSEEYTVATVHRRYNDERRLYLNYTLFLQPFVTGGQVLGVIFRSRNTFRNQIGLCIGVVRCGT